MKTAGNLLLGVGLIMCFQLFLHYQASKEQISIKDAYQFIHIGLIVQAICIVVAGGILATSDKPSPKE